MVGSHSSEGAFGLYPGPEALLMRMSRPPKVSSAHATRAPTSSGRETLQWRKAALPPLSVIWRTVSWPPESLMSETSTQQPSEARRTASVRPEPSPPDPVTTAILPDNSTEMRPSGDPSYLSRLRLRDQPLARFRRQTERRVECECDAIVTLTVCSMPSRSRTVTRQERAGIRAKSRRRIGESLPAHCKEPNAGVKGSWGRVDTAEPRKSATATTAFRKRGARPLIC